MSERGQPIYLREDEIIISRAEYEAYRAAAKVLFGLEETKPNFGTSNWRAAHEALAALRAAGIDPSEGKANE